MINIGQIIKGLSILILSIVFATIVFGQHVPTGIYDEITIAYDSVSNEISGYVSSDENEFDCYIIFKGIYDLKKYKRIPIDIFLPNDTSKISDGFLTLGINKIYLHSTEIIPPCQMVLNFSNEKDLPYSLTIHKNYKFCGSVKSNKVYIYRYSNDNSKSKMYLMKDDFISVIAVKDKWLLVEYQGKRLIKGWLKKEDVYLIK